MQSSYNKRLQREEYTVENKEVEKKLSYFPGSYWLIVTAVFLGYGFYTGEWSRGGLLFPVAGVLFAAVYEILKASARRKQDR